jgi:hypothetical protein
MYVPSGDHEAYNSVHRFCYVRQWLSGRSTKWSSAYMILKGIVRAIHASVLRLRLCGMLHIDHGQEYWPAKRGGAPVAH